MSTVNRRAFLSQSAGGLALAATPLAFGLKPRAADDKSTLRPNTLFLTWQRDPTTTMTVQWIGAEQPGGPPPILFSPHGKDDWKSQATRMTPYPLSMYQVFRAELTGLAPGSEYQFRIGGHAPVYRFRTMPAKATDSFTFVSGGDCGIGAHAVANNILAARQDPMFALIGGDLGYDNGRDLAASMQFVRNYSEHMIDSQGRLIPLVVCIGNHEVNGGHGQSRREAPFFFALHDGLFTERSYATLDFGDYLSLVLLDTGHVSHVAGEQTDWLDKSLSERAERPHLIVANHVPAYPSVRLFLTSGIGNRKYWVPLFEKHNVDIVLEHHDHAFKRSHPLRDNLIDEKRGVLYLGDGSWGKIRPPEGPEKRPYLAAAHEAYHISLHRLEGDVRYHMAMADSGKIVDVCTSRKRPMRKPVG